MKLALCAEYSEDRRFEDNLKRLKRRVREAKMAGVELLFFGEAFLQGFGAMSFDYAEDIDLAFGIHGTEIAEVRAIAAEYRIGIGVGFYENYKGAIYSSYLVVDDRGNSFLHYRRRSKGWKMPHACADYREGTTFESGTFRGKRFGVMICGDFWEEHLLPDLIEMEDSVDFFVWPVHCDYFLDRWERTEKELYRERSAILGKSVLYCNNWKPEDEMAKGGAYHWHLGREIASLSPGEPGMLMIEI